MTAWIFPACLLIIFFVVIALFLHNKNIGEIKSRVRKIGTRLLSISVFLCLCFVVLISTFSYASDYFTTVLSADFIANSRLILKLTFGSESVFTSMQLLGALSLFLFSFASFAVCIYFVGTFILRGFLGKDNSVDIFSEKAESEPVRISGRRFALLSKYLL